MELTDEMQNKIIIGCVVVIILTVLFSPSRDDWKSYPQGSYTPRDELTTMSER